MKYNYNMPQKTSANLTRWLDSLGYFEVEGDLVSSTDGVSPSEPYAPELCLLLDGSIDSAITAVATIDRMPTACFVELDPRRSEDAERLMVIRRAVWNQNLVSLVLVVSDGVAFPCSAIPDLPLPSPMSLDAVAQSGIYSYRGVAAGALLGEHPDWFDRKNRVDRRLLANLGEAVKSLSELGVGKVRAQYLLGQSLFISYLEHRCIAGPEYRRKYGVGTLLELVRAQDRSGLDRYITRLKESFNGDFLAPEVVGLAGWAKLPDASLSVIADFLSHTDISGGQMSLWAYDFRFIPVELISGIYETFLSESKSLAGAYYTPRNLAAFTVDQAFGDSCDITQEVVYDGACGSGILLVTAFRRMLHAAELKSGEALSFAERSRMLMKSIRGSDINTAACLVTAFSLYLSLLENLRPADLTLIGGDDRDAKLPELLNVILWSGEKKGDFFSKDVINRPVDATVFISNPPWREPRAEETGLTYEAWAAHPSRSLHLPHRQIAAAFAHRALDVVSDTGRVCLILPAKLFLSETSQEFVEQFIDRCRLKRVISFADVRLVLFPEAIHPCVVVLAEKLPADSEFHERALQFDYWVPKADISIAHGRLTVHGSDRHQLPLSLVARNNQALRTYLWGGPHDQALMLRLSGLGRLGNMVLRPNKGDAPRWIDGKGFHRRDKHKNEAALKNPDFLLDMKFLHARKTPPLPVMDPSLLQPFPYAEEKIASYGAHDGKLFFGPRVMLNDGVDFETFEAKAVFSNKPFSFQHSIGAFAGPDADEDLLRFLAVYLRSSLARYLLLMDSYALTVERQRISMKELKRLPFVPPEQHSEPQTALGIIQEIAKKTRELEKLDSLSSHWQYKKDQPVFDGLVAKYFGLSANEIAVVEEAAQILIPSIQPTWSSLGTTPLCGTPNEEDLSSYVKTIEGELNAISSSLGGAARIHVDATTEPPSCRGAIGICRISHTPGGILEIDRKKVEAAIAWLRKQKIMPLAAGESLNLTTDFLFFYNDEVYLVKPLVKRFWLRGQARRDALRLVKAVRQNSQVAAA